MSRHLRGSATPCAALSYSPSARIANFEIVTAMSSLDENKLPFYAPISRAPTKYNPFRPGYKQEDIDPQPLIEAVYNLLGAETVRARLLGRGFFNVVYEFDMKTGPPLVSRIQWNFKADPVLSTWVVEKMTREVAVLELLQRVSPQVPAPRVLAFDFAFNNSVGAPFTIMNRLYGEDLWMAWPTLSADDVSLPISLETSSCRLQSLSTRLFH
ncbi:hypothetical protein BU17DRAFT_88806 [Hysterangium stoloniferum]|nr:hypothetical protein BU17DRAFT_88806 [Hysterangium stoloniferum]